MNRGLQKIGNSITKISAFVLLALAVAGLASAQQVECD